LAVVALLLGVARLHLELAQHLYLAVLLAAAVVVAKVEVLWLD
jgi:hypothetical protein